MTRRIRIGGAADLFAPRRCLPSRTASHASSHDCASAARALLSPPLHCARQTLGYWSIRGLAQAIRYVLAYAGVPFNDVRYQQGGAPDLSRSAWTDKKESLQLDFPNLPYYIEGDAPGEQLRLTQSTTILRHLGRKHLLSGATLAEQARCDLVLDTVYDFKSILVDTAYSRQRAEALAHFASHSVPHYCGQFEKYRQNHPTAWSAGDHLTIADFVLSEMLMQADLMVPGMLEQYPLLKALVDKFIVSDIWTAQRWRALSRPQRRPWRAAAVKRTMPGSVAAGCTTADGCGSWLWLRLL